MGLNVNSSGGIEKSNSLSVSPHEELSSEEATTQLVFARVMKVTIQVEESLIEFSPNSKLGGVSIRPKMNLGNILENRALIMNKAIPLVQQLKEGLKTKTGGRDYVYAKTILTQVIYLEQKFELMSGPLTQQREHLPEEKPISSQILSEFDSKIKDTPLGEMEASDIKGIVEEQNQKYESLEKSGVLTRRSGNEKILSKLENELKELDHILTTFIISSPKTAENQTPDIISSKESEKPKFSSNPSVRMDADPTVKDKKPSVASSNKRGSDGAQSSTANMKANTKEAEKTTTKQLDAKALDAKQEAEKLKAKRIAEQDSEKIKGS